MAKLGRYAADRKKIVEFNAYDTTTLAKTIKASECGTIFCMTAAADDGNEGATITLPSVSEAGAGWWCKFVLMNSIVADSDDNNDILIQNDAGDTNNMVVHLPADAGADGAGAVNGASITFKEGAAEAGDTAEFICTGSRWLVHVMCATVGSVTKQ